MRYALVTGTDHGIGLELARQLLKRGYFVTACRYSEKEPQIDVLKKEYPRRMQALPLDIGSDGSVAAMALGMLWLYFCLLIVLFGALLNETQ